MQGINKHYLKVGKQLARWAELLKVHSLFLSYSSAHLGRCGGGSNESLLDSHWRDPPPPDEEDVLTTDSAMVVRVSC